MELVNAVLYTQSRRWVIDDFTLVFFFLLVQSPVGKVGGLPLVPSAAQVRSLRKGSNDQLAITIDSESERLLSNKSESFEDKGLFFFFFDK